MAIGPTIENLRRKRADEAALLEMLYSLPTPTGGFDINTPAERRQLAERGLRGGEPYSDGRMDYGRQRPNQNTIDVMPQQPAEFYAREVSRDLFGERATNDLFGYPQGTGNLVGDILTGGGMLGAIGATAPLTAWDAGAAAARGDYGDAALKSAFSLLEGAQLGELATGARGLRAVANEFPEAAQEVGQRVRGFLADESGSLPLPFKADDPAQARGFLADDFGTSNPPSFGEYLKRVNPSNVRVAAADRPNLMMGDMYGMLPRGARRVQRQGDVTFYKGPENNYFATAFNPDVGEQDVVGYIMPRGDMTELAVVGEMQGRGIGSNLQYLFRKENPDAPTGGLTEAGERALRRTYERLVNEGILPR